MKKSIKRVSAVLAAVMCSGVITAAPVTAAEYTAVSDTSIVAEAYASDDAYTEAVKLAGVKYSSSLAKKVESYMGKSSKTTVKYKNSRTKKMFMSKLEKRAADIGSGDEDALKSGFSIAMVGKDSVTYMGMKGDKTAIVAYQDETGIGMYSDSSSITITELYSKQKITQSLEGIEDYSSDDSVSADSLTASIGDNEKAKVFKFDGKSESYTLEVFEINGEEMGFLFNSKNQIIGGYDYSGYYSIKFSLSPKTSSVTVPDYYTEVQM